MFNVFQGRTMKLTTFLAAFAGLGIDMVMARPNPHLSARPEPTSPQLRAGDMVPASPGPTVPRHAVGGNPIIFWDPPDTYSKYAILKERWGEACQEALAKEDCDLGMVHKPMRSIMQPDGKKRYYLNVEGAPLMNMKNTKRMRVFKDGTSVRGWTDKDRYAMKINKSPKKDMTPLDGKPWEGPTTRLTWDPPNAYKNRPGRRNYWEPRCDRVLTMEGCNFGTIHQGESKVVRNGKQIGYVKVEGAPSAGTEEGKQMRVFQDGSYEHGWSARDIRLIKEAKYPRRPDRRRGEVHKPPREEGTTSETTSQPPSTSQEHTEAISKHRISWNPPNAYNKRVRRFKQSYEKACARALEESGCDFGMIRQGQHRMDNDDGTKSFYMDVFAGKDNELHKASYMRLFEDGTSFWYPPDHPDMPKYAGEKEEVEAHILKSTSTRGPATAPSQLPHRILHQARPQSSTHLPHQAPTQKPSQRPPLEDLDERPRKRRKIDGSTYYTNSAQAPPP